MIYNYIYYNFYTIYIFFYNGNPDPKKAIDFKSQSKGSYYLSIILEQHSQKFGIYPSSYFSGIPTSRDNFFFLIIILFKNINLK